MIVRRNPKRLEFAIRVETSAGWRYLCNTESWHATTLHETLAGAGSIDELVLTENISDARRWLQRGVSTAHHRIVRALSECCLTQSVAARFSDMVEICQVSTWKDGELVIAE
jgi:hypothetical protein